MARLTALFLPFFLASFSTYAIESNEPPYNIKTIQTIVGAKAVIDKQNNSFKFRLPRNDLDIIINGMKVTPEMGLTSIISLKKNTYETNLDGDLILLQDQVNPVISSALRNGFEVTALYNPFLWDSPRVLSLHIHGTGGEIKLAKKIASVLKEVKHTTNGYGNFPLVNLDEIITTLNVKKIENILGKKASFHNATYKFQLKNNTWVAFAGSDAEAIVDGSITFNKEELQKFLITLRNAEIYILAIHPNLLNENESSTVTVHYWGMGKSSSLARSIQSAFQVANSHKDNPVASATPIWIPANLETRCDWDKKFQPIFHETIQQTSASIKQTEQPGFISRCANMISSFCKNLFFSDKKEIAPKDIIESENHSQLSKTLKKQLSELNQSYLIAKAKDVTPITQTASLVNVPLPHAAIEKKELSIKPVIEMAEMTPKDSPVLPKVNLHSGTDLNNSLQVTVSNETKTEAKQTPPKQTVIPVTSAKKNKPLKHQTHVAKSKVNIKAQPKKQTLVHKHSKNKFQIAKKCYVVHTKKNIVVNQKSTHIKNHHLVQAKKHRLVKVTHTYTKPTIKPYMPTNTVTSVTVKSRNAAEELLLKNYKLPRPTTYAKTKVKKCVSRIEKEDDSLRLSYQPADEYNPFIEYRPNYDDLAY